MFCYIQNHRIKICVFDEGKCQDSVRVEILDCLDRQCCLAHPSKSMNGDITSFVIVEKRFKQFKFLFTSNKISICADSSKICFKSVLLIRCYLNLEVFL